MVDSQFVKLKYVVQLRGERVEGEESDLPYLGLEHIESGVGKLTFDNSKCDKLPKELYTKGESLCNIFDVNDVLFGKLRPYLAKTWVANFQGRCTTEILVFVPKICVPDYLKFVLLSEDFLQQVNASTSGAKMPRADWNDIGNQLIYLPSFQTQLQIVDTLNYEIEKIDNLIRQKENVLTLLTEKKQALITQAVTCGLDASVPMKDSGIEWIGEVPEHWEIVRLKYLGSIYYGLGQPPEYQPEGIPLIRATNVYRGGIQEKGMVYVNEEDIPDSKKVVLKEGDIIVVRSGAYTADSAMITKKWEGSIAGFDMIFRTNERVVADFISQVLLSSYVLNTQLLPMSIRAAQPHLNSEELGSVLTALPPIYEQKSIIEYLLNYLIEINSIEKATRQSVDLLRERRAALISAAVTGQLDIP